MFGSAVGSVTPKVSFFDDAAVCVAIYFSGLIQYLFRSEFFPHCAFEFRSWVMCIDLDLVAFLAPWVGLGHDVGHSF